MKEFLKAKKNLAIAILVIVIILIGALVIFKNRKSDVDNDYILLKLEKASELTTAKLTYRGYTKFTDEGIRIISRSDFVMTYTAVARAGIDVKEVEVDTNKVTKTITLTIPRARILDVKVEPDTIKYYDEKFALFNFDKKEDANKAQKLAEDKAKEELSSMGILEMADEQAESLLKGLLTDAIPSDYKIVVKRNGE